MRPPLLPQGFDRRGFCRALAWPAAASVGLAPLLTWPLLAWPQAATPRVIDVVARKFVFLPAEIVFKRNEPVLLRFTAPEVVMGFHAPALDLRTVIVPGKVTELSVRVDREGQFEFVCDIFCGDGHETMGGHILVTA